jgi:hypothetical protein
MTRNAPLAPAPTQPPAAPRTVAGTACTRSLSRLTAQLAALLMVLLAGPATLLATMLGAASPAVAATLSHHETSSTPGYCRTGGAAMWNDLAACGWPGPSNTGPKLAQCPRHRLAARGGHLGQAIVIRTPGAVVACQKIRGMLFVEAPRVVIKNVAIISNSGRKGMRANGTAAITVTDGASATVTNTAINGDDGVHACIWHMGSRLTVNGVNCYGADDGIFSWADTGHPAGGDHFTITASYFHGLTTATANGHEDGYQTEGASDGLIEHNTYRMSPHADSAIAIWDSRRSARHITVTGNLITGGGFAVYAEDYFPGDGGRGQPSSRGGYSVTGIRFTSNVFSTYASGCVGKYGVWFDRPAWSPYHGGPTDGWHRSGNRVLETGEEIDSHNPSSNGSLCR